MKLKQHYKLPKMQRKGLQNHHWMKFRHFQNHTCAITIGARESELDLWENVKKLLKTHLLIMYQNLKLEIQREKLESNDDLVKMVFMKQNN